MFGPLLDEPAKGQEIEDAGMHIDDGEGGVIMVEEVINFPNDEVLDVIPEIAVVILCVEVEEVGCR